MSGYLDTVLVDVHGHPSTPEPQIVPAQPVRSPLALADQRLHDPAFAAELAQVESPEGGLDDEVPEAAGIVARGPRQSSPPVPTWPADAPPEPATAHEPRARTPQRERPPAGTSRPLSVLPPERSTETVTGPVPAAGTQPADRARPRPPVHEAQAEPEAPAVSPPAPLPVGDRRAEPLPAGIAATFATVDAWLAAPPTGPDKETVAAPVEEAQVSNRQPVASIAGPSDDSDPSPVPGDAPPPPAPVLSIGSITVEVVEPPAEPPPPRPLRQQPVRVPRPAPPHTTTNRRPYGWRQR